jgi:hypothetical protein
VAGSAKLGEGARAEVYATEAVGAFGGFAAIRGERPQGRRQKSQSRSELQGQ